jgi:hypothetical protein
LGRSEALIDEAIDQDPHLPPRTPTLLYPAALPLSSEILDYAAGKRRVASA